MLFVLLGPSGVGKTSLIQMLVEEHDWKPVISYITRPSRADEKYKTTLESQDYLKKLNQNEFFSHVEQFGFMYGTLQRELELAINSPECWVIDFGLTDYQRVFSSIVHLPIIVLPEDESQLRSQLQLAGRSDRANLACEELREKYEESSLINLGLGHVAKIRNRKDALQGTVQKVLNCVKY